MKIFTGPEKKDKSAGTISEVHMPVENDVEIETQIANRLEKKKKSLSEEEKKNKKTKKKS